VDGRKIGHHHAKCLGPIDSAENLAANSIQFIGYFVGQWEYERGVNALKWNVQPRAVIERNQLRLSGFGFEIHDDVFREGVLSADFEHSEKLAEMALGEFGIDGEPELSACLHGSNDSTLWSDYGFLRSGHGSPHCDVSYSICICVWKTILQPIVPKRVRLKEALGEMVDSLHEEEREIQ
jgi:hypothetical protein